MVDCQSHLRYRAIKVRRTSRNGMNISEPRTGYELAAKILATHPDDAIETMLRCSHGTESDWLEFKAGMTLRNEDRDRGESQKDLYWKYAKSIVAMANTYGGAFVIGIDNKHNAVPLSSCDPNGILKEGDTDDYIRIEILDRIAPIAPKPQSWTDSKGVSWTIDAPRLRPLVEAHLVKFRGEDVVVLLVKPTPPHEEILVARKDSRGDSDILPHRTIGDVGEVVSLTRVSEIQNYQSGRIPGNDRYAALFGQAAPTLFICHSSKDDHAADQFRHQLEANGVTCWFAPNDISGGDRWADSIDDAIDSSTALLVLVSRHSMQSKWVKAEVTRAFQAQKRIIPVRIDNSRVDKGGMRLILSGFQMIDATQSERDAAKRVLATLQNRRIGHDDDSFEASPVSNEPIPLASHAGFRFRSEISGCFVKVVPDESGSLLAIASLEQESDSFEIVQNDDGTISFKAISNGRFVSVRFDDEAKPLRCCAESIDLWEKFTVEESGKDSLLKTAKDGLYVQTDIQNGNRLRAKETTPGTWERFAYSPVPGSDAHSPPEGTVPQVDVSPETRKTSHAPKRTPLDELALRFREVTIPNDAGIPPIVAMTDGCPMLNKFIWASGGNFFWETIAEGNGWKLQRNKFFKQFRVRDPVKTCRACGWSRRMRKLFFPEVVRKAKILSKRPVSRGLHTKRTKRLRTALLVCFGVLMTAGVAGVICIGLRQKSHSRVVDLGNGQFIRLLPCPAGEFWMGSPSEERGRFTNEVRRLVTIDRFFWAGETEITQGQWQSLMGGTVREKAAALESDGFRIYNPVTDEALAIREYYNLRVPLAQACGDYDEAAPMYYVSWSDAIRFCRKLTERERSKGALPEGYEYRLPTEEEWEYFARAGRLSAYPNGMDMEGDGGSLEPSLSEIAWFKGNSQETDSGGSVHRCSQLAKNDWGFYDVIGNVWEWCMDTYESFVDVEASSSPDSPNPSSMWLLHPLAGYLADRKARKEFGREWMKNDIAPMTMKRAIRGGSWNSDARVCRVANRRGFFSPWGRNDIGFRVVLAPVLPMMASNNEHSQQ